MPGRANRERLLGLAGAFFALAIGACANPSSERAPGGGDAAPMSIMQELTRPAEDSLARSAMPADVWAARDSLASFFRGGHGSRIMVTRSSGRVLALYGHGLLTTCRVTIQGRFETRPDPNNNVHGMIEAYLEDSGWVSDLECSADGPDGTSWGMRRGGLRCLVHGHWDGGDDSDTTYVPSPEYVFVVDVLPDRPDLCPHP